MKATANITIKQLFVAIAIVATLSIHLLLKKSSSNTMVDLKALSEKYFKVWNAHDVPGLANLFTDDVHLRDWDIEKHGKQEVADANGGIFKAVPKIAIEVLKVHVSESSSTATCEILVKLNNDEGEILKVCDVITFDGEGQIKSVMAYKG